MTTSLKPVKHLPEDLITSGYGSLIERSDEYAGYAELDHGIANELIPALKKANESGSNHQGYKAVVQALFESEFLSTRDRDFNTDQLINYIYGVKCASSIPSFQKLHTWLMANGHTDHVGTQVPSDLYDVKGELRCFDCDNTYPLSHKKETGCTHCTSTTNQKTWNPSGDNYYSAYQFEHKLSDTEQTVIKISRSDRERPKTFDRVIVVENQSPMWAFVVMDNPFTGQPDELYIVRLKCNYDDKDRLPELLELVKNNQLENNHDWSGYNDTSRHGVIACVKIDDMECKPVLQPKHIESALFNIYSGCDCL
jgi:hypothetical protein